MNPAVGAKAHTVEILVARLEAVPFLRQSFEIRGDCELVDYYSPAGTRLRAFLMVPRSVMILSCKSVIA